MHPHDMVGHPDFYFPKRKLALFVDGCFWHGCLRCGHIPRKNNPYWSEKIRRNRERDREKSGLLRSKGIQVLRIWEHELKNDLPRCIQKVKDRLRSRSREVLKVDCID
jgi:DNA mismatch endonuclease Vsr